MTDRGDKRLASVLVVGFGPEPEDFEAVRQWCRVLAVAQVDAARAALDDEGDRIAAIVARNGELDAVSLLVDARSRNPDALRVLVGELPHDELERAIETAAIWDYVAEPTAAALRLSIRRALEHRELLDHRRSSEPRTPSSGAQNLDKLVYRSVSMARVADQARQAAATELPVLIQGETGTGKELLARAVHQLSARSGQPLVVQNCGAASDDGLLSAADGGTIFLDEISEVSPGFQASLLRVLQTGAFKPPGSGSDTTRTCDVRVIAASNRPLWELVETGKFRSDLYFRLNGFELLVPPLRQRRDDILVLADYFVWMFGPQVGRRIQGISPELAERLVAYDWPGNVRELENEVRRMLAVARDSEHLDVTHLSPRLAAPSSSVSRDLGLELEGDTLKEKIEGIEATLVLDALERHRWNQSRTARDLGLSRPGLANKIKRYRLRDAVPRSD